MELESLRPLFAGDGPRASVRLDATRAGIGQRWRGPSERLARSGADPATIAAIGEVVREHPCRSGCHGLAIFARGGEVVPAEPRPASPAANLASWGWLPHATSMVALRGEEIPYVRVAGAPPESSENPAQDHHKR